MAQSAFNPNAAGKTTVPVASITSADSPYALTASDVVVIIDASSGAVTVTMPAASATTSR